MAGDLISDLIQLFSFVLAAHFSELEQSERGSGSGGAGPLGTNRIRPGKRRKRQQQRKSFQHPMDSHSQSASPWLISPHFAAGAVGARCGAASFLATESTGTALIPRRLTSLDPRPSSPPDLRPSGRGPGKTAILFRVFTHKSG